MIEVQQENFETITEEYPVKIKLQSENIAKSISTLKSSGGVNTNIILNKEIYIGTPESFKVLVCELQALCLDIGLFRFDSKGFLKQVEHLMKLP